MKLQLRKILVLAPHTDDAELGCGASIARFLEEGVRVTVAAFSTAEESLPPGSPPNLLRDEFLLAMRTLGIAEPDAQVFAYPVRRLSYHRQEVLEDLVRLRHELDPDLVLAPSGSDLHQDHQVLHAESLRVFKDGSIWGYELPWNHVEFAATAFVTLEERHLKKKWDALQAYQSQLGLGRPYFSFDFLIGLARLRGVQVKSKFAEAFDLTRIRV
jgi:LmbE family N-acetylglucosaminyl deacetylase